MKLLKPSEIWVLIKTVFWAIVLFDVALAADKAKRNTYSQVMTDKVKKEKKYWLVFVATLICTWLPIHFWGDLAVEGDWLVIGLYLAGGVLAFVIAKWLPF